MSDFTSDFWNLYVIVLVVVSLLACAWLLLATGRIKAASRQAQAEARRAGRGHRARLGRRPGGVQQSAAEVVVEPVLDHAGVLRRLPDPLSGSGQSAGGAGLDVRGAYQKERADADERLKPLFDKYAKMSVEQIAADPAARQTGERMFLDLLLTVPWLRRRRQPRVPEPARLRLALRRRAGDDRRRRSPAAGWA